MNLLKSAYSTFKDMSRLSKIILRIGAVTVVTLVTLSLSAYICAGRLVDYYTAICLSDELYGCVNPCIGITALGILLFEGAQHYCAEN